MKKKTTLYIDTYVKTQTDTFLAKIGYKDEISFSDYVELALRLLNAVVGQGKVPDDLGILLLKADPEALNKVQRIIHALEEYEAVARML